MTIRYKSIGVNMNIDAECKALSTRTHAIIDSTSSVAISEIRKKSKSLTFLHGLESTLIRSVMLEEVVSNWTVSK